jgi:aminoglycoside phosphotransferase (APT) family kinase protein
MTDTLNDLQSLAEYLEAYLRDTKHGISAKKFSEGQSNPTYLLNVGETKYVLRKKPEGELLPSAHAVDREYRVITALYNSGVPVPKTYCLCEDRSVIGTEFYVMEYVPGRIFWDPALPELNPDDRGALYNDINRVISVLHSIDYHAVGLESFGKPANYFQRQIGRWTKQYLASQTEQIQAMDDLIAWLPQNIPQHAEASIVHGDLRVDNMIVHPSEPRIMALLDWELSTLGNPMADFAYHVMTWRLTAEEFRGMAGKELAALNIPGEREYVLQYCRNTGHPALDEADWEFYIAYSMFRLAAMLQGILHRALAGTASSHRSLETGRRARRIAEIAWRQVETIQRRKK